MRRGYQSKTQWRAFKPKIWSATACKLGDSAPIEPSNNRA